MVRVALGGALQQVQQRHVAIAGDRKQALVEQGLLRRLAGTVQDEIGQGPKPTLGSAQDYRPFESQNSPPNHVALVDVPLL